jgi:hypothetical protein
MIRLSRPFVLPLLALALVACRDEAPRAPAAATPTPQGEVPLAEPPREPVELADVVETDPRYIVGITYPPEVNRYPGLAAELKAYSDAAREDLMEAVAGLEADATAGTLYDLALEYKVIADTPEIFAVAADGSSFTGGAHGAPLIARFVWLPQQDTRLTAAALVPGPAGWRAISDYVREQLHTAVVTRADEDELAPTDRAALIKSTARMIDEGTEPDAGNFSEFVPVLDAAGRITALRFVFPPYQVGPYADGTQAVDVPAAVLLPHVAPEYAGLFAR